MRHAWSLSGAVASILMLGAGGPALGGERVVSGGQSFMTHCAVCHGVAARGDGPLAESLRVRPPDLTLLARRNGGRYSEDTVRRIIDGRKPVKGHGGPDMPVWGDAFKAAPDGYSDAAVREKIVGIVEYLRSIQAPAK
jgi:mono/diheme cytochrome c family protein